MVRAGDAGALDVLGQRQAQTMQALQYGAEGAERELSREFNREMMQRQAAQAALEGGLQNIAGGASQIGSAAVLGLKGKTKDSTVDETALEVQSPTSISDTEAVLSENYRKQTDGVIELTDEYMPSRRGFEDGGMITGGKFSHKTNPIDIVRGGQKIGEMTGGEVILNPAQQKKLSKESAYFRSLLKKFNKQK